MRKKNKKKNPRESLRHYLSLLSWIINDAKIKDEGTKTKTNEFLDTINCHHIVRLQETKMPVKVANYR